MNFDGCIYHVVQNIEDFTRVVISYEISEMSLR